MSSEIQFGELEHSKPRVGTRPDRDAHFAVLPVGPIGLPDSDDAPEDDLLIFVDLDVMRDMEAHAASDTRVELGGVMLGKQLVDEHGKPFVVITDCLRAEHYHATKGSFTFTHDTWSQITRQRKLHHPELEMLGWYHTHPGWTVFLSGMDLFICNNFFNKPLDVALVIDPVKDDRGWFQWTDDARPVTRPTKGFYLMTNRYRQQELKYFSRLYSNGPEMNVDPRYSENSYGSTSPVVNIMDNRRPLADLAIIAMLTLQFMVLGLLAWKIILPPAVAQVEDQQKTATVEDARNRAYEEILRTAVSAQGQDPALVDIYTALKTDNARLLANLDGQLARAEKLATQRNSAELKLASKTDEANKLSEEIEKSRLKNKELSAELAKSSQENGAADEQGSTGWWKYLWWSIGGLLVVLVGASGFMIGHRKGKFDAFDEMGEYDHLDKKRSTRKAAARDDDGPERVTLSLTDNPSE